MGKAIGSYASLFLAIALICISTSCDQTPVKTTQPVVLTLPTLVTQIVTAPSTILPTSATIITTTTVPTTTPPGLTLATVITVKTSKLTLSDAPSILDLSSNLQSGFRSWYDPQPSVSKLLGIGSGSEYHLIGTPLGGHAWYQIQTTLWIVDPGLAQQITVEAVLEEYNLAGYHIDVGNSATAVKYGEMHSGLEFIVIKDQNVFVLINASYYHPESVYVPLQVLAMVIVERLDSYLS